MPRTRIGTSELARLLDAAAQPIYVLSDDQVLVFCNWACLEWVGLAAEQLQGRKCAYHSRSEMDADDALAAGLCPPPQAIAGQETTAVVGVARPDGGLSRRQARFLPFRLDADRGPALLVMVNPCDLPEGELPAETCDKETARLHERVREFRRQAASRYSADRLIGDSPMIRRARALLEVAAVSRASVLIVGPQGSGRQHLASAIHYAGRPECGGPLIPLACSVLDAELIRSTVAAIAAEGLSGQRGTLLLNEADELPLEVQSELAHTLNRPYPLRVLSTAGRSLREMVARGEYREELALTLSTLEIEMPSLARRRADLPLLLQLFLEEANAAGRKQIAGFTPEAIDMLDGHSWPGNVDELIRVVQEAHARAEGPEIGLGDLPERLHLAAMAQAHPRRAEERIVLEEFMGCIEQELLRRALVRAKGNKTKAAKLLGMTRPRLYRRLVQLGIERPRKNGDESVPRPT